MHSIEFDELAKIFYFCKPLAQVQLPIQCVIHRTVHFTGPRAHCASSAGFMGKELILTPKPVSAFSTAAATAGATPTAPDSPTPLMPNGFPRAGVSSINTSIAPTSVLSGRR